MLLILPLRTSHRMLMKTKPLLKIQMMPLLQMGFRLFLLIRVLLQLQLWRLSLLLSMQPPLIMMTITLLLLLPILLQVSIDIRFFNTLVVVLVANLAKFWLSEILRITLPGQLSNNIGINFLQTLAHLLLWCELGLSFEGLLAFVMCTIFLASIC